MTPAVIITGGKEVILSGGCDDSSGKVALHGFMLADGRKLAINGWENCGATMIVKPNEPDVVFFTGGGEHGGWIKKGNAENPPPAAVRFTLNGDALNATVLWSGVNGKSSGGPTKITYCGAKLYGGGFILDAADGKVLYSGREGKRASSPAIPPSTDEHPRAVVRFRPEQAQLSFRVRAVSEQFVTGLPQQINAPLVRRRMTFLYGWAPACVLPISLPRSLFPKTGSSADRKPLHWPGMPSTRSVW